MFIASPLFNRQTPWRLGFRHGLKIAAADGHVYAIHAGISGPIPVSDFKTQHPHRKKGVICIGIAAQNKMGAASGTDKECTIPVTGTDGVFAAMRWIRSNPARVP